MFAIIGSGFGLYGYLPAIAAEGERIALPERYRERFNFRTELAPFAAAVSWFADEAEALARADGAVVAVRPGDQPGWAARCLARDNIRRLILEKPLATTPEAAEDLLGQLIRSRKSFRIGYTFRHTAWARRLLETEACSPRGMAAITWRFLAHHYRHGLRNWKQFRTPGGGALRFYGIHLIALLAELGYRQVVRSDCAGAEPDDIARWTAAFAGPRLDRCAVSVDARSRETRFTVEVARSGEPARPLFDAEEPFAELSGRQGSNVDRRIAILREVFRSLSHDDGPYHATYEAGIRLWREVESKTSFSHADG